MSLTDYVQVLLALVSITAIVVVGRSNIKKQIISDLQALVLAHEQTINQLKLENIQLRADSARDNAEKDERICALEETIDGYSELVRAGYLLGSGGPPGRNRSTSTKAP
jgi:lipase chaperone LimK